MEKAIEIEGFDMGEVGLKMLNWHSSGGDPIYAVGSYFFAGRDYPKRETVEDAIANLERDYRNPAFSEPESREELAFLIDSLEIYVKARWPE